MSNNISEKLGNGTLHAVWTRIIFEFNIYAGDGGNEFLQNAGNRLEDYTAS